MEQTMLEAMMSRKSVRDYTDQMVSDADIEKVLKAGQYAANGRGRMATKFVVVKNREIRDELSKMNADIMGTTNDPFYGAPVVIWVLADRNVHTYVEDGSLAIGNMLLEAHALGLGACWIHRAKASLQICHERGCSGKAAGRACPAPTIQQKAAPILYRERRGLFVCSYTSLNSCPLNGARVSFNSPPQALPTSRFGFSVRPPKHCQSVSSSFVSLPARGRVSV